MLAFNSVDTSHRSTHFAPASLSSYFGHWIQGAVLDLARDLVNLLLRLAPSVSLVSTPKQVVPSLRLDLRFSLVPLKLFEAGHRCAVRYDSQPNFCTLILSSPALNLPSHPRAPRRRFRPARSRHHQTNLQHPHVSIHPFSSSHSSPRGQTILPCKVTSPRARSAARPRPTSTSSGSCPA